MPSLSYTSSAMTSKALQSGLQLIAKCLSGTALETLAAAIGKDDTTQVSRIRSGQLGAQVSDVARMLYAAGLKVVPVDRVCVDRATYEAMSTIAAKAMSNPEISRKLTWDETE